MPVRNGEHSYGFVTKLLHWLTVLMLLSQLTVGLTMEGDAAAERAKESAEAREDAADDAADRAEEEARSESAEESAKEAGDRAEESAEAEAEADRAADTDYLIGPGDGVDLLDVHVLLGASILLLGVVRVLWRRVGGLPPWAAGLSGRERVLASWTEKVLLAGLFLVPGTGLILVLSADDAFLPLHIAAQLLLGLAVAVHLVLVLGHTVIRRDRLLQRMLCPRP